MKRLAVLLLLAAPAAAQEFVTFDGPVSDDAFYRAVSCAALPDADCQKPILRWPEEKQDALTVGLASITPRLGGPAQRRFEAGVENAIRQINGTGSAIQLSRDDLAPDIAIHVLPIPPDHPISGTGIEGLDGRELELGLVVVRSRNGEILEAKIAISALAPPAEVTPVLLEEITQALGFLTDLRGPDTQLSVFGEDTNSVRVLSRRDADAIRRHYPAP